MNKPLNNLLIKPAGPDCPMACTYCFYREKTSLFPESTRHRMTDQILEETIRQFLEQSQGNVSISWQGGEPTLMGVDFFQKAVDLEQKFGQGQTMGNGLQTGGILIDEKWARFLQQYNFLVGLSIDGPEHVHNKYRFDGAGKGTWERVSGTAKRLLDASVAVNALTVVNDYSVHHAEEIYTFLKELGLVHMQFIPAVEINPDNGLPAPFTVSGRDFGIFLTKIFDLWINDFRNEQPTTFIRFFDSVLHHYADLAPPECTLLPTCGIYLTVEHNGNVYPCDFFVEQKLLLGNVTTHRLDQILNSDIQTRFGQNKSILPRECRGCNWLSLCRGGCPKDRIAPATNDRMINHLCEGYKLFFEHADQAMKQLAMPVKESNKPATPVAIQGEVGRNDPCPCGSGKKYKKCCMKS